MAYYVVVCAWHILLHNYDNDDGTFYVKEEAKDEEEVILFCHKNRDTERK